MAEATGLLKICDRCGETVFLKTIGDGEADGGYTRWNKFEAPPEGWDYSLKVGTLCPKCNATYNKLLERFMNNKED